MPPDIASLFAATVGRGDSQREAYAACSAALTELAAAVNGAVGDAPDVSVSVGGIYVGPEWDDRGRRRIGYVGAASVAIRAGLADAARLGQAALDAGAIRLDGPSFEIADPAAVRDELLVAAVAAARATAERMAAAAGRSACRVVRIREEPTGPTPGWPVGPAARMVALQAEAPPLEPAAQELAAAVSVTFELVD